MTFTEAAEQVLRLVGRPLHYKEITAHAIEKNLLSHVGKTPETTMGTRLAALFRKNPEKNPIIRIRPGVFALKEWEESGKLAEMIGSKPKPEAKTVTAPPPEMLAEQEAEPPKSKRKSAAAKKKEEAEAEAEEPEVKLPVKRVSKRTTKASKKGTSTKSRRSTKTKAAAEPAKAEEPAATETDVATAPTDETTSQVVPTVGESAVQEKTPRVAEPETTDTSDASAPAVEAPEPQSSEDQPAESEPVSPEDSNMARLAKEARSVFAAEEDDDQPIIKASVEREHRETKEPQQQSSGSSSSRRRRRRRRPKNGQDNHSSPVAYSASPADRSSSDSNGRSSGTGQHSVLVEVASETRRDKGSFDELGGRDMADAIAHLLEVHKGAANGAVSLRQLAEKAQERSRHGQDLQLLQSQLAAAIRADNLRRTSNGDRPRFRFVGGRVSMVDWNMSRDLLRLEREAVEAVQRYREAARVVFSRKIQELPGHAFVELALMVFESLGFSNLKHVRRAGIPGNEAHYTAVFHTGVGKVRTALVIRKDGREIGRERVSELRGSLHHYGPAMMGWIATSGSILSGARDEAGVSNAGPIMLLDNVAMARLCEQHGVAVTRSTLPIAIPDLDVLEALRDT